MALTAASDIHEGGCGGAGEGRGPRKNSIIGLRNGVYGGIETT